MCYILIYHINIDMQETLVSVAPASRWESRVFARRYFLLCCTSVLNI